MDPATQQLLIYAGIAVVGFVIRHYFPALGNLLPGGTKPASPSPAAPAAPGLAAWVQAAEVRIAQLEGWLAVLIPQQAAAPAPSASPLPPAPSK